MVNIFVSLFLVSCTEYKVQSTENPNTGAEDDSALLDTQACIDDLVLDDEVIINETCAKEQNFAELDFAVEWKIEFFSNFHNFSQILMAPVIGQLTDDNGDGNIDEDDIPDIVTIADDGGSHWSVQGLVRIISGRGEEMLAIEKVIHDGVQIYPYRFSNVALGNITGDSTPELVFIVYPIIGGDDDYEEDVIEDVFTPVSKNSSGVPDVPCHPAAFTPNGTLLWVAYELELECGGHAPYIADLEGDGNVEVVVGSAVIEGQDGTLRAPMNGYRGVYYSYPEIGMHSVVADLDMDGQQEIIAGPAIFDSQGDVICIAAQLSDGFNAIGDFDNDGFGDVVNVGNGVVSIFDRHCQTFASWPVAGGGNGGPPTITDFDIDGQLEIGVADAFTYSVYEQDGSILWSHDVDDESSHATGSVIFDFDNDGRPEVVYADETRLWVFAGADGTVRLEDDRHASRTLHEYPTIADVDGDGSSEIIVPNGGGHLGEQSRGLYVLGPTEGNWAMSRQTWNQYAYSITNIDDDLQVPLVPEPNWLTYNNYRNADPQPAPGWLLTDLYPIAEICPTECPVGPYTVVAAVANQGTKSTYHPVQLSVYTDADSPTIIASHTIQDTIASGEQSMDVTFAIEPSQIIDDEIWLEIYSSEVEECLTNNNRLVLATNICP